jgi:hypothetical protein
MKNGIKIVSKWTLPVIEFTSRYFLVSHVTFYNCSIWRSVYRAPLKMYFFRDCRVSSVLVRQPGRSSCTSFRVAL